MSEQQVPPDLSAEPYAAVMTDSSSKKFIKLMLSDQVMLLLADIITANLSSWHMVLSPAGKHGKRRFLDKLVDYINSYDHELLRGRKTTSETVGEWIKNVSR